MKNEHRHYLSIGIGLLVLILLALLTFQDPPHFENLAIALLFGFLVVFTTTFGVPVSGGTVSMLPMSTIAAFLVIDSTSAGWVAFLGAILNGLARQVFSQQLGVQKTSSRVGVLAVSSANASIQTLSVLVGGAVYKWLGGAIPLQEFSLNTLYQVLALAVVYLMVNLGLIAGYMAARGTEVLKMYWHSIPNLLLYEAVPLVFVPLMVLTYTRLGFGLFILLSIAIVVVSLIARGLALTSRGLERRVQELNSLQAVGQALSANLRLDDILPAIYEQVAKLMPASNFYVALYFSDSGEVTFPLAVEDDQQVEWRSRHAGKGLTEFVLQTCKPLLIESEVEGKLSELGIEAVGKNAASWLGVPITAGEDPLGVIAVQSYDSSKRYDQSHKEILITIAAQAGIAIQNARLYERTDEALARRVQELNSILKTSAEGLLLLSLDFRVLAANRAFAVFLGVNETELSGGDWGSVQLGGESQLWAPMGYTLAALQSDCQTLAEGDSVEIKKEIQIPGSTERHLERTLTPVLDLEDQIVGWLLVFRDISEEIELARLREDMTHMLVHDLRSPLTALRGSLWLMRSTLESQLKEDSHTQEMLDMADRNTERIMGMVDSLLDIAKLENGQMPLYSELVEIPGLFSEIANRVKPLAEDARIAFDVTVERDVPEIRVDPEHARRVIINLIDNAIKFTPDGGQVRLWAKQDDRPTQNSILIGVSDTGPGISEKVQKKLFQKFQQDSKVQGRRKGTGLGLAYCKLVVEAHDGEIWVESQEGQGATFVMRLPIDHR
jgi:NtrC-family two-component system sensor histidine kinase KinB